MLNGSWSLTGARVCRIGADGAMSVLEVGNCQRTLNRTEPGSTTPRHVAGVRDLRGE